MLGAHAKTPLEALYLETNSVPIRFILKSRRIMYLHNILQRNQSEMVRKIYELQKRNPCHGDYYEIVRDDMLSLDLNLSEDDISKMKKQTFKAIVKVKVKLTHSSIYKHLKTLTQRWAQ